MFHCELCGHSCDTKFAFVRHMKVHKNVRNMTFKCALPDCKRIFRKVSVFKTHVYRDHQAKGQRASDESGFSCQCTNDTLSCHVDFCTVRCDSVNNLLSHLKGHIREGRTVSCPFRNCGKRFFVVSTFSSHLSRTHKKYISSSLTFVSGAVTHAECLGEQAENMNMQGNVLDDADREEEQSDVFSRAC